jgi:phosphoenolpyruvate carboxylase
MSAGRAREARAGHVDVSPCLTAYAPHRNCAFVRARTASQLLTDSMQTVKLISWDDDLDRKASSLKRRGLRIDAAPLIKTSSFIGELSRLSPAVLVLDLDRLPSQSREIAVALRTSKSARHIPVLFAGGLPEKIARVRAALPDASFTSWADAPQALATLLQHPPSTPAFMPPRDFSTTPLCIITYALTLVSNRTGRSAWPNCKRPPASSKEAPLRRDVRSLGMLLGEVLREQAGAPVFEAVEELRRTAIARREADWPQRLAARPRPASTAAMSVPGHRRGAPNTSRCTKPSLHAPRRVAGRSTPPPTSSPAPSASTSSSSTSPRPTTASAAASPASSTPRRQAPARLARGTLRRSALAGIDRRPSPRAARAHLHLARLHRAPHRGRAPLRHVQAPPHLRPARAARPHPRPRRPARSPRAGPHRRDHRPLADRRRPQRAPHRARRDPHGARLLRVLPLRHPPRPLRRGRRRARRRVPTRVTSKRHRNRRPPSPQLVSFGSWIGGDRDGNPFVTPEATREALAMARGLLLTHYRRRLQNIFDQLASSTQQVAGLAELTALLDATSTQLRTAGQTALENRFPYESVRLLIACIMMRLGGAPKAPSAPPPQPALPLHPRRRAALRPHHLRASLIETAAAASPHADRPAAARGPHLRPAPADARHPPARPRPRRRHRRISLRLAGCPDSQTGAPSRAEPLPHPPALTPRPPRSSTPSAPSPNSSAPTCRVLPRYVISGATSAEDVLHVLWLARLGGVASKAAADPEIRRLRPRPPARPALRVHRRPAERARHHARALVQRAYKPLLESWNHRRRSCSATPTPTRTAA